jgi:hypothetical protein
MNRHRITLTTALAALAILAAGCVLPTGPDTVGVFVGAEKIGPDYKRGSIDKVTRIDDDVRVEGWATSYGFNANRNPASLEITLMNDDGIIISTATPVASLRRDDVTAAFPLFTGSTPGFIAELGDPSNDATRVCVTVRSRYGPEPIAPCKRIPAAPTVTTTTTTPATTTSTTTSTTTVPAPTLTVTGVNPTGGPSSGGDMVTITGTGFSAVVIVMIGGAPASFSTDSDTQIRFLTPPGVPGVAAVTVNDGTETSAIGPNTYYSYLPD